MLYATWVDLPRGWPGLLLFADSGYLAIMEWGADCLGAFSQLTIFKMSFSLHEGMMV